MQGPGTGLHLQALWTPPCARRGPGHTGQAVASPSPTGLTHLEDNLTGRPGLSPAVWPAAGVCVGSLDSALCSPRGRSEAHLGWISKLLCPLTCHLANSKLVHLALQDVQGGSPGDPAPRAAERGLRYWL